MRSNETTILWARMLNIYGLFSFRLSRNAMLLIHRTTKKKEKKKIFNHINWTSRNIVRYDDLWIDAHAAAVFVRKRLTWRTKMVALRFKTRKRLALRHSIRWIQRCDERPKSNRKSPTLQIFQKINKYMFFFALRNERDFVFIGISEIDDWTNNMGKYIFCSLIDAKWAMDGVRWKAHESCFERIHEKRRQFFSLAFQCFKAISGNLFTFCVSVNTTVVDYHSIASAYLSVMSGCEATNDARRFDGVPQGMTFSLHGI